MSRVVACSVCTAADRVIGGECRRNERRLRAGKPVDLTRIEQAKADQRKCAAAGHWQPTPAAHP